MISPFIDANHPIQSYFPERKWGIAVPIFIGVIFLTISLVFIGVALLMDSKISEVANRRMDEKQREERENQRQATSSLAKYRILKTNRVSDEMQVQRTISKEIINGIEQSVANSSVAGSVHNQSSSDLPPSFADKKQ
ncbi:dolichol phosphate-mannose biosynthesis regulatory [Stylonychia lemnae]|uniref:Dolichol phosphate-mannose biosynthesis regulatory protein n=1 Tax=Stylonychia lemnae TaxID=5949 RepID=A0A078ATP0_STYLE|nr:dolichol phosphate-mannose biosynthesis regulatory [Stylonychia lemnae]|eukprot:CDW85609.1 dolichol phosphate-mannose biosynthesis regulatory [Stylonychia lemnae]